MSVGTKCCSTRVYVMLGGLVGMVAYLFNAYATDASQLLVAQGFLFGKSSLSLKKYIMRFTTNIYFIIFNTYI